MIRQKSNLDHFPVVQFSDEFQEVYGRSVMAFAEVVHSMARNGDSAAVQETITALCWVFAGAREIVRQKNKSRLN